jgi:hypothetical protein
MAGEATMENANQPVANVAQCGVVGVSGGSSVVIEGPGSR